MYFSDDSFDMENLHNLRPHQNHDLSLEGFSLDKNAIGLQLCVYLCLFGKRLKIDHDDKHRSKRIVRIKHTFLGLGTRCFRWQFRGVTVVGVNQSVSVLSSIV